MRIELTAEEQALFDTIRFDPWSSDFHTIAAENGNKVAMLMRSLARRKAIPQVRLHYFGDPELFPSGRGKSHQQVFQRNGCVTSDMIFMHPHFLDYLHYFIRGPRLSADVVARFGALAKGEFRELGPLRQFVRARTKDLNLTDPGEEFFKLALDCELELEEAKIIRRDAMNVARPRP